MKKTKTIIDGMILNKTTCATIIGTPRNDYEQNVTEAFFQFIFYFLK